MESKSFQECLYKHIVNYHELDYNKKIISIIHTYILFKSNLKEKEINFNTFQSIFEYKKNEFSYFPERIELNYVFFNDTQKEKIVNVNSKLINLNVLIDFSKFDFLFIDDSKNLNIFNVIDNEIIKYLPIMSSNSFNNYIKNDYCLSSNPVPNNSVNKNQINTFSNREISLGHENPYYLNNKNGISGEYVGPDSKIFSIGPMYNINNNTNSNINSDINKGIRYDPIGPFGFDNDDMPNIEKKLWGERSCGNFDYNLIPKGYKKN